MVEVLHEVGDTEVVQVTQDIRTTPIGSQWEDLEVRFSRPGYLVPKRCLNPT